MGCLYGAGLLEVYPRVYGGTGSSALNEPVGLGLSPRVRGNPAAFFLNQSEARSIPACTGEPPACRSRSTRRKVYPRVYGGTDVAWQSELYTHGLSPRVRGNPPYGRWHEDGIRSIPACTGEPGA